MFVIVETFIPPGKSTPSSGMLNAKTSPVGQSPWNKVVLSVLSCKITVPAPLPSEARIKPLNLVLPANTAPVPVTLTAFTSDFIF